jgi:Tfp pilus assembly protein PilN
MQQFRGGINLVPLDIAESRQVRRNWMFAAGILVGVAAILAILTIWEGSQAKRLSNRVEAQKRENAALESRARELEYLEALQTDFESQRSLVQAAWTNEVSWAKVLQEIAAVMPDGVYLSSFSGEAGEQQSVPLQGQAQQPGQRGQQAGSAQSQAPPLPPSSPSPNRKVIGKVTIQAVAKNHREVGNWLYRVNRGMPSLTLAWVRSATLSESSGSGITVAKVNFSSEAYLSPYAMGWMGRCAERGFENLSQAPYGVCGLSFYGAQVGGGPAPGATGRR